MQSLPLNPILSIGAYWIVPIVFALLSFLFPEGWLYSKMGLGAMFVLAFLMFLKPVAMLSKRRELLFLLQFRRQLGIMVFWLALFHGAGFFVLYELWDSSLLGDLSYHYFYGLVALAGMSILGLTSNDIAVKFLKKNWKRVHWLAYPAFIFTLLHAGLANGSLVLFSVVSGIYIVLKYFEWKQKNVKKGNGCLARMRGSLTKRVSFDTSRDTLFDVY